jgi:hypothetical protein
MTSAALLAAVILGAMPTLTTDLPCGQCGYNLRGLDADDGRCPECGWSIAATVAAADAAGRRFRPDLRRAAAGHRRAWVEGLVCVLAGAALTIAAGVASVAMERRPAGKVVLLAAMVAGWVVHGAGLWKVATADVAVDPSGFGGGHLAVRATAVFWTLFPATVLVNLRDPLMALRMFGDLFLLATAAAAVAFHARLWALARAAGATVWAWQCVALALGMAAIALALLTAPIGRFFDPNSLEMMRLLPWPSCGSPSLAAYVAVDGIRYGEWAGLWQALVAAYELLVVSAVLWQLRRAVTPAGAARNTAPSSPP